MTISRRDLIKMSAGLATVNFAGINVTAAHHRRGRLTLMQS